MKEQNAVPEPPLLSTAKRALLDRLRKGRTISATPRAGRIPRRERRDIAPASLVQERIWFIEQLTPGTSAYHLPFVLDVHGELDPALLKQCLEVLSQRHESLRTRFELRDGALVQIVSDLIEVPLQVSCPSPDARPEEIDRIVADEMRTPFALDRDVLFRVRLLRLLPTRLILIVTLHHLIGDGWSKGVLLRELAEIYDALVERRPPKLEAPSITYGDFAAWQRDQPSAALPEYWRDRFATSPEPLELPTDRPRPAAQSMRGARQWFELPKDLVESLTELGRRHGVTLFVTLVAGLEALLHRYTGRTDIAIGTPVAGRIEPELEALVGCFVNTLVLRTACSAEMTFEQLLGAAGETVLGALAEPDLPFERLIEHVKVPRDLSRNALFQVLFVFENTPMPPMRLGNARLSVREAEHGGAQFDLLVYLIAGEGGALRGFFEYATDLFDAATMERMARHFENLLGSAAKSPRTALARLEMMSAWEHAALAGAWAGPTRDYGSEARLPCLLEAQAHRTPDRCAIVFRDQALTYRELHARVNRLAHYLRTLGVGPDVLVGVSVDRSIELVVALLAITAAGGAYVPLDPSYPAARSRAIAEDARLRLVLGDATGLREAVLGNGGECIPVDEAERRASALPCDFVSPSGASDALAYVIYTSGSTGQPKGVLVPHRGVTNRLAWMQEAYFLGADDRVLQKTPFGFDVSVWEFFWPLLTGACLIVAEPGGHRDPNYLVDVVCRERVTTMHFVPSMLRVFLASPDASRCQGLRRVICSGEALSPDLVRDFHLRFPTTELHNLYGPTEASVDVSAWECVRSEGELRPVPIGRPIANTQLYVLDERRQPVPFGVPGELYIGGVQLARGYLNRPELTAARFVDCQLPEGRGGRLYATGDRAKLRADGNIEYLGRLDRQVKVRGHRIELGEIEAVLGRYEEVAAALVVPRTLAGAAVQLIAYVTPEARGASLDPTTLRKFVAEALPEAMVPSAFVRLDEMPVGANGKVDLQKLPLPERDDRAANITRQAPRNAMEAQLAEIWRDVLGVSEVSVFDNFFSVGGDSILSIQVVMRARAAAILLEPRHTFAHQTIAELAELVASGELASPESGHAHPAYEAPELGPHARRALRRSDVEGIYPLLPVQQHMLRAFLGGTEAGLYHIQRVFVLEGTIDPALFALAWRDTVRRHPILRSVIALGEGEAPLLVVHADNESALGFEDVRHLDPAMKEECIRERYRAAKESRLDLGHPEPMALRVYRFSDTEYRCALMFNYMFLDGWSLGIVFRDFVAAYLARARHTEDRLPKVPTLDAYFAAAAAEQPKGEEAFWRRWLDGAAIPTSIVASAPGAPPPGGPVYTRQHRVLGARLSAKLGEAARHHQVTLNTLVQGCWALLLGRYAGVKDVVFGVTSTGRPATMEGVERLAGPFISTLPVRVRMPDDGPLDLWLREIQQEQQRARIYERTPQHVIRESSRLDAERSLFDHYLVFQNLGALMAVDGTDEVRIVPTLPSFYTKTEVPLRIDVFPGDEIALFMSYYERHLSANAVARMLDDWTELLTRVAENPAITIAELRSHDRAKPHRTTVRALSPLVQLKSVQRPRARLVCFPHGGGGSAAYRPWRSSLPADVDLRAVRLPGRDGRNDEPLLRHMVGMAGEIAEAIAHDDDGVPLVFFGHSLGAIVSLETARSLCWRGHPGPRHLVVSGSRAPRFPRRQKPIHHLGREEFLAHIRGYGGTPPEVLEDDEVLDLFLPVMRADFTAVETYCHVPEPPLPIPVTVLGGERDDVWDSELMGWQDCSTFPIRRRMFPGHHFFVVSERDAVLSEVIRAIDAVTATSSDEAAQ